MVELTKAQARVLSTIVDFGNGQGYRDEFGRQTIDVLIRNHLVDAPIGDFGRVYVTEAGRAALSRHKGEAE